MIMTTVKKMFAKLQMRTRTILELKLTPDHGFFISLAALLGLEYLWLDITHEKAREATFGKNIAILYKQFNAQHKEFFGVNMSRKGYPDPGNNRFSDALPYADWLKISGAELAKNKFVEEISLLVPSLAACYSRNRKLTFVYAVLYVIYGILQKRQLMTDPTTESVKHLNELVDSVLRFAFINGVLNGILIILKVRHPLFWGRGWLPWMKSFFRKGKVVKKP